MDATVTRLRDRLREVAHDREEAEALLAKFAQIEHAARSFVAEHIEFSTELDRLLCDWSAAEPRLADLLAKSMRERKQFRERILALQEELKQSLGAERWEVLAASFNDAEAMHGIVGRDSRP